jgi:hypothetical protein
MSDKNKWIGWGYKPEPIKLTIDAILIRDVDGFFITSNDEGEKIFGNAYGQGKTIEEAEKEFWNMVKFINDYNEERSREFDKWGLFQKGDWKHIGGTWFTLLGINVYFRTGKGMKGGWYVPFTKLNISIHNHWIKRELK